MRCLREFSSMDFRFLINSQFKENEAIYFVTLYVGVCSCTDRYNTLRDMARNLQFADKYRKYYGNIARSAYFDSTVYVSFNIMTNFQ